MSQWLNKDTPGIIIASFAWICLITGAFALSYTILYWKISVIIIIILLVLSNSLFLLCLYTHFLIVTTNPGTVPKNAIPTTSDTENSSIYPLHCDKCDSFKPSNASHCDICNRCVSMYDHHCPWMNNCIGLGNRKLFLLFLLYVFITCIYSLILILFQYITCIGDSCGFSIGFIPGRTAMWLCAEACMFSLFTFIMGALELYDIYLEIPCTSIHYTKLDSLRRKLSVIFGTQDFQWNWLQPIAIDFNEIDKEVILGYSLDDYGQSHE